MTTQAVLSTPPSETVDEVTHWVRCHDEDVALCGTLLPDDDPWLDEDTPVTCPMCVLMEEEGLPCPPLDNCPCVDPLHPDWNEEDEEEEPEFLPWDQATNTPDQAPKPWRRWFHLSSGDQF